MSHPCKYLSRFLFLLSIAIILYATLYCETGQGDIQFQLLWTIKGAWREYSGNHWYLILGNTVLFMPFEFFFIIILREPDWEKATIIGFVFSSAIEAAQVLTDRGLGELDDILHSTQGSLMGCCAAVVLGYSFGRHSNRYKGKAKGISLFFGITILVFTILIFYNQPDWSVRLRRQHQQCLRIRLSGLGSGDDGMSCAQIPTRTLPEYQRRLPPAQASPRNA